MLGFNTLVALGITAAGAHPLGVSWVFAQCIGLSIWALTEPVSRWWVRVLETDWPRLLLVVPLGAVSGYMLGSLLAALCLGLPRDAGWSGLQNQWHYLLLSLLAGAGCTYFFVSRTLLQQAKERQAAAQLHLAQAQLQLLQAQLEPHMLFNTLANLRVLIAHDPARATQMLDRLVDFLRATLSASRQTLHPLSAEFARLQDYLALMAVRMGPRLQYTLDLPADLAAQTVPSLLLQPLVENGIRHGLEPKVAGGSVHISARRAGSLLVLEVTDSGGGLPAHVATPGFGLTQVREQLKAAYGAQGAMECIAGAAGGCCVRVQFPLKT
jgi:signal transduction histidine kinase